MAKKKLACIGEVLWDCLPEGKVLGGAPSNVAWHAMQMGAESLIISAVGDDEAGRNLLLELDRLSLPTKYIPALSDTPTSKVDAMLDSGGNATYVIHSNVAWDRIVADAGLIALAKSVDAVNFGTLAQRSPVSRESIRTFVKAVPFGAVRMFDINLRPPFFDCNIIAWGLENATVAKMNDDELTALVPMFSLPAFTKEAALEMLLERYSNLEHIILTLGADGMIWANRTEIIRGKPTAVTAVIDTVGAGDSVTATAIMGLLHDRPIRTIVEAAIDVACHVCTCRGATPVLPSRFAAQFC